MLGVMRVLAWPVTLAGDGTLATVDDQSDDGVTQEVSLAILQRPGERLLAPDCGVPDPIANGLDVDDVNAAMEAQHTPAVCTQVVEGAQDGTGLMPVTIMFDRTDQADDTDQDEGDDDDE